MASALLHPKSSLGMHALETIHIGRETVIRREALLHEVYRGLIADLDDPVRAERALAALRGITREEERSADAWRRWWKGRDG